MAKFIITKVITKRNYLQILTQIFTKHFKIIILTIKTKYSLPLRGKEVKFLVIMHKEIILFSKINKINNKTNKINKICPIQIIKQIYKIKILL